MTDKRTYTIDAGGRTLGRVASEAAKALMGKTCADYTPHVRTDVEVRITNAAKMHSTDKKRSTKTYGTYSGYPGGLRTETWTQLAARKGSSEIIRRAVSRMLPRNTMKTARMKNLIISE